METLIVISLFIVIGMLVVDRFLFNRSNNKLILRLTELQKSKDMGEYIAAKTATETPAPADNDEVDLGEVSDKEFLESIKKS